MNWSWVCKVIGHRLVIRGNVAGRHSCSRCPHWSAPVDWPTDRRGEVANRLSRAISKGVELEAVEMLTRATPGDPEREVWRLVRVAQWRVRVTWGGFAALVTVAWWGSAWYVAGLTAATVYVFLLARTREADSAVKKARKHLDEHNQESRR